MKKSWIQTLTTFIILFTITTALYMYTSGYRLNKDEEVAGNLKITGMIGAKSIPEGANIYVNDQLISATNTTIPALEPGKYTLKIVKSGFVPWSKEVEVFAELVTDITAVLISQSPRLEPLTNTGAKAPSISPTLSKVAFFSKDENSPGVWVIPLIDGSLNIFRANAENVLLDTTLRAYSDGNRIEWSPDEKSILVTIDQPADALNPAADTLTNINSQYFLVTLGTNAVEEILDPALTREEWNKQTAVKREAFLAQIDIPDNMKVESLKESTIWAPDNKKFLYEKINGEITEYRVFNMEKPLPIGEKIDTLVFTTGINELKPVISWYSDSYHLILTEDYSEDTNRGAISLIRIDGSNKTEIYSNTLHSDMVYSAPGGDKLIITTSFKSGDQTDLYTLGIR